MHTDRHREKVAILHKTAANVVWYQKKIIALLRFLNQNISTLNKHTPNKRYLSNNMRNRKITQLIYRI